MARFGKSIARLLDELETDEEVYALEERPPLRCCGLVLAPKLSRRAAPTADIYSAKQLSRCMTVWQDMDNAMAQHSYDPLSALEMRYVVRANVANAKGNFFGRMFRWNYYDVTRDDSQRVIGMFATRFNSRFEEVLERLKSAPKSRQRLEAFGELLSYLQDVSTPSRVVPVYTGRWWAFNMQDRFDRFPIDDLRLESNGPKLCDEIAEIGEGLVNDNIGAVLKLLLTKTAANTLTSVNQEIPGCRRTGRRFGGLRKKTVARILVTTARPAIILVTGWSFAAPPKQSPRCAVCCSRTIRSTRVCLYTPS